MDINELLHREQVSLANAANAACAPSRHAHEGLARGYGARLTAAGFPHRPFSVGIPAALARSIRDLAAAIL
jgi:hypothetical protein